MRLPVEMRPLFYSLSPEAQISIATDYNRRRKSKGVAYLAWFFLGWHYLYLRRVGLQFAFWLTAGGFLVWWFIDLFRVGPLVNRMNEDTARELMVQYNALMPGPRGPDPHLHYHVGPTSSRTVAVSVATSGTLDRTHDQGLPPAIGSDSDQAVPSGLPTVVEEEAPNERSVFALSPRIAIAAAGAVAIVFGVYAMIPSSRSSAADPADVSFTVARDTNVRSGPSTKDPVIGAVGAGEVLSGKVQLGPNQVARWLQIDGGPHAGGYVSLTNLKK